MYPDKPWKSISSEAINCIKVPWPKHSENKTKLNNELKREPEREVDISFFLFILFISGFSTV
jgi:hypothetical protein